MSAPTGDLVYVAADAALEFVARILVAEGIPPPDARTIAACLVRADLRGVDTHGISRLPVYIERLRRKLINPTPILKTERVALAASALDGQNGFGFVVATLAMSEAIAMAGETGIGVVSVRRSTHFGMAASYVLQAVESGLIAIVFTNASPGIPPWGSRTALFGTSPLAVGAPGGTSIPFVLDMSPAVVARGKIRKALQLKQAIPASWALDAEGRPTTDPQAALRGVLLPIGAHKGAGLSMMMDVFGGVISGAAYAGEVGDLYRSFDRPQNVGHFFLAMRPDLFISIEEYRSRMDRLLERIHSSDLAEGFDEVVIPGEIEGREERHRQKSGIPYAASQLEGLQKLASESGVPPLSTAQIPN
jgi:LDH2 family malate/lactate/ureidoglycolate dehydrogenase